MKIFKRNNVQVDCFVDDNDINSGFQWDQMTQEVPLLGPPVCELLQNIELFLKLKSKKSFQLFPHLILCCPLVTTAGGFKTQGVQSKKLKKTGKQTTQFHLRRSFFPFWEKNQDQVDADDFKWF